MLAPPWPDLLFTVGGRSAVAAHWIKAQSGGRTRLISLGRPWAPLHWFDLVITTPQYRLPPGPNVLQTLLPLNQPPEVRKTSSNQTWHSTIAELPTPRIAVLVGGGNASSRSEARDAADLAGRADALARETGGSLMVTTSPRTDPEAARALVTSIRTPHISFLWSQETRSENPYVLFLDLADQIVVTGDSASMIAEIAEACGTRATVFLYELPETRLARFMRNPRLQDTSRSCYPGQPDAESWRDRLTTRGWWVPRRDMTRLHRLLLARGRVTRLGEQPLEHSSVSDLDLTLHRIRQLIRDKQRVPG